MLGVINMVLLVYFVPLILSYIAIRINYKYYDRSKPTGYDIFCVLSPFFNIITAIVYVVADICSFFQQMSSKGGKNYVDRFFRL